ncbi:SH3 domain-containing protein [uncultured Pontibacter sp.]|uniref:SH3 domain-containing protein n=1 Tax=uncultured Pontibacter sp. TaxID=453356 RepID=UPI00260B8EAF|nr:SH3 domain-containing protein [uncultured Pontibacter sp.]
MLRQTFCSILILLFNISCANTDTSNDIVVEKVEDRTTQTGTAQEDVDVFDIPALKKLFVTNTNGSYIYEKADKQSSILDTLEYGYQVEIIGEESEWYQIKERISRSFLRNGNVIHSSGWEEVNILKQNVGDLSQIKLKGSELYETYDKAPIKSKIELKLISEAEFNSARNKKEGFLVKQETLVSSKDSVLTVANGNGTKKVYVSTPDAEVDMQIFNYVGHINYLNAYLLGIGYYEGGEYKLYDATSGEEVISFNDYPEISPDGRYIVSMYTNPYEQSTDFQLHTVGRDKKIKKELEASFINWMVALEPYEVYWLDNTTLVMKVMHSKTFWDETGNLNNDSQYLKMKIL